MRRVLGAASEATLISLALLLDLALGAGPWLDAAERLRSWPLAVLSSPDEIGPSRRGLTRFYEHSRRARRDGAASLAVVVPTSAHQPFELAHEGLRVTVRIGDAAPLPWLPSGDVRVGRSSSGEPLFVSTAGAGLEDYRIIERPRAGALARYELGLGPGAHLRVVERVLEVVDSSGTPRIRMARPLAIDASGRAHALDVTLNGCAADRSPRPPWGRAPTPPGARVCGLSLSWTGGEPPAYPLLVDPSWTTTSSMTEPRVTRAIVLGDRGQVLLPGGRNDLGDLSSSEIFDEATGTFAVTSSLPETRSAFASSWVESGRGYGLVVGGCEEVAFACVPVATGRAFDPALGTWRSVAPLESPRALARALPIPGGRVLILGGLSSIDDSSPALASTELFDGVTESYLPAAPLPSGRVSFGLASLADGGGVVVGGRAQVGGAELALVHRYDPVADQWLALPDLPGERRDPFVRQLEDGRIAVVGGSFFVTALRSTVVFDDAGGWQSAGALAEAHDRGVGTALPNGWLLMAGGANTQATEAIRLGDSPGQAAWSAAEPLPAPRASGAQALLPSGRWLLAGGYADYDHDTLATAVVFELHAPGVACSSGVECASGHCVDDVCCVTSCDAPCSACSVAAGGSADGECSFLAPGVVDEGLGCQDEGGCGQTGVCAEGGSCALRDSGASCACEGQDSGQCNGEGTCTCAGSVCVDDSTERDETGITMACEPYRCAGGGCLEECSRSDDCVPGAVCDRDRVCVDQQALPEPIVACACRVHAGPAGAAGFGAALAALAACWLRRSLEALRRRESAGRR